MSNLLNQEMTCPPVDERLVEHLSLVFSDRLPGDILTKSEREIGALHGQCEVVRYLANVLETQKEDDSL